MSIATKPTKSNVAWPKPSQGRVSSTSVNGADRFFARPSYRRANVLDPHLARRSRIIIAHNGVSLGNIVPR